LGAIKTQTLTWQQR